MLRGEPTKQAVGEPSQHVLHPDSSKNFNMNRSEKYIWLELTKYSSNSASQGGSSKYPWQP